MRRRALLSAAAGGLTATAGCLGPAFGFGTDCPRGTDLRLQSTTAADTADGASDPVATLSPPERDAVAAAVDGDEPTMWAVSPPFSSVEYVVDDGTYYAVETTVVSTADRSGYEFTLDTDGTEEVPDDRRVAFEDLPAADRTALYSALGYPNRREMDRFERARAISIGGTLAYPDDEAVADSALVPPPAPDVLRIAGRAFRFRLGETRSATVETHRVAVQSVAASPDEFAAHVYEQYGIDLDERDLSAEQRDIVETAIEDGYDECAPYSDAYADLQDTLGGTGQGEPRDRRVDYVNYEDEWYFLQLSEYVV